MTEWLKFYFLGFFSQKLTRQAARRRYLNVVLGILLTFILLFAGLFMGYTCSFGKHYGNSSQFREFVYSVFASGDKHKDIHISVKDGKLNADIPSADYITPYAEHGYNKNGYVLVVDTRPVNTFDDFYVTAEHPDGNIISYERYEEMSADAKKSYSLKINYSGNTVNVNENREAYTEFLSSEKCPADAKTAYEELNRDYDSGKLTDSEYADGIYIQYVKGRYPELPADRFGDAPTVRAGEVENAMKDGKKALLLFDNICIVTFCTDDGIWVDFDGYFRSVADRVFTSDGGDNRAGADDFISEAFATGGGADFVIYFLNILRMIPLFIMVYAILSLASFAVLKLCKSEYGTIVKSLKIVGSFLLFTALLSFFMSITVSFFTARDLAFTITIITFNVIWGIRTLIMIVYEIIKSASDRRNTTVEAEGN